MVALVGSVNDSTGGPLSRQNRLEQSRGVERPTLMAAEAMPAKLPGNVPPDQDLVMLSPKAYAFFAEAAYAIPKNPDEMRALAHKLADIVNEAEIDFQTPLAAEHNPKWIFQGHPLWKALVFYFAILRDDAGMVLFFRRRLGLEQDLLDTGLIVAIRNAKINALKALILKQTGKFDRRLPRPIPGHIPVDRDPRGPASHALEHAVDHGRVEMLDIVCQAMPDYFSLDDWNALEKRVRAKKDSLAESAAMLEMIAGMKRKRQNAPKEKWRSAGGRFDKRLVEARGRAMAKLRAGKRAARRVLAMCRSLGFGGFWSRF